MADYREIDVNKLSDLVSRLTAFRTRVGEKLNTLWAGLGDRYTKSESDGRYALRTRTITGTGSLTGGGNLTANRTLDLTATAKSDIAKGVTAHGWGNHASAGYALAGSLDNYIYNIDQNANRGRLYYRASGNLQFTSIPVIDTRSASSGLGSDGAASYLPPSNSSVLNSSLTPLFHYRKNANTWVSSILMKGWTGSYGAWMLSGNAHNSNSDKDRWFLSSSDTDTGEWGDPFEIIHAGNLDTQATSLGFIKSSALSGYVPTSRTLTAGNGLTGGGNLTANRTFTLGTPSAITLSSTNSVGSSSHTHEFKPGGTTAQYIRGDGSLATYANTTYSAGTLALLQAGTNTTNRVWSAKILSDYVGAAGNFVKKSGDTMSDKLTISNSAYQRHLTLKRGDIEFEFAPSTGNSGELRFLATNGTRYLFDKDVRSEGDIIAYSSSDSRLKDNIHKLTNPIDRINKIGGYSFQWNNKQDTYEGDDVGLLAQEIENIIPSAVTTRKNGYKAVKYEKVIPLLVEGIKELDKENKELKDRLKRLEDIVYGN